MLSRDPPPALARHSPASQLAIAAAIAPSILSASSRVCFMLGTRHHSSWSISPSRHHDLALAAATRFDDLSHALPDPTKTTISKQENPDVHPLRIHCIMRHFRPMPVPLTVTIPSPTATRSQSCSDQTTGNPADRAADVPPTRMTREAGAETTEVVLSPDGTSC